MTLQAFYGDTFGVPAAPVVESRVTMLSRALGVSIETLYPIAALALEGESLIEADEMPAQVRPAAIRCRLFAAGHCDGGFRLRPHSARGTKALRPACTCYAGLPANSSNCSPTLPDAASGCASPRLPAFAGERQPIAYRHH